ncbi:hypothetical protein C8R46DRAFT_1196452, partial [Mycena filopes]
MLHLSSTTTAHNSTTGRRLSWTLLDVAALSASLAFCASAYLAPIAHRPAPSTLKPALKRPASPLYDSSSPSPVPAPIHVDLSQWDATEPEPHSDFELDSDDEPQSPAPIPRKVRFDVPEEAASPPLGRWDDGVAWSDFMHNGYLKPKFTTTVQSCTHPTISVAEYVGTELGLLAVKSRGCGARSPEQNARGNTNEQTSVPPNKPPSAVDGQSRPFTSTSVLDRNHHVDAAASPSAALFCLNCCARCCESFEFNVRYPCALMTSSSSQTRSPQPPSRGKGCPRRLTSSLDRGSPKSDEKLSTSSSPLNSISPDLGSPKPSRARGRPKRPLSLTSDEELDMASSAFPSPGKSDSSGTSSPRRGRPPHRRPVSSLDPRLLTSDDHLDMSKRRSVFLAFPPGGSLPLHYDGSNAPRYPTHHFPENTAGFLYYHRPHDAAPLEGS